MVFYTVILISVYVGYITFFCWAVINQIKEIDNNKKEEIELKETKPLIFDDFC